MEPPHFDDVCDIGTIFLGCNSSEKSDPFQLEHAFPINSSAYVTGQLPDNQVVERLIDTGALHSIMTKAYYDACPSLAKLPKLKSCQEHCLVGNGQRVAILFTIPVLIFFVGHTFEINTQVTTL